VRRRELRYLKKATKALKVDCVCETLTKACWQFGTQYSIIVKNNDTLEIKLSRGKKEVIIKFHKTLMVFIDDYERFLATLSREKVNKGVYITTGVFEHKVIRNNRREIPTDRKIKLEDMFSFGRRQLGWKGKAEDMLRTRKLNLYKYLP
jgi:hypothetical protein